MHKDAIVHQLNATKEFFDRSTRPLTEEHSTFAPQEGLFTVSQQIAHVAQTVDWFFEGAFRPESFDMDFEAGMRETMKVNSVQAARQWLDRAFAAAIEKTKAASQEEWDTPMPPNMIMGETPRWSIIGALVDHTAHHRGALTVYSRLQGLRPPMPYADM